MMFVLAFALLQLMPTENVVAQNAPAATAVKKPVAKPKSKTPAAVTKAFAARFPTVKDVKFDREKNGEYEAGFKTDGKASSANFTATGEWVETETEIAVSALPAEVTAAIKKANPDAAIVGAAKIETAANGTRYEADLKRGLKKTEVLYDVNGNLVK